MAVLWLVLFVAIANLGIGFALAEFLARSTPTAAPQIAIPKRPAAAQAPLEAWQFADPVAPPTLDRAIAEAAPAPHAELPADDAAPQSQASAMVTVNATAVSSATHDIPAEWLAQLAAVGPVNSFAEAAIEVLKLQVGEYRDQLVEIDRKARAFGSEANDVARAACLGVLREVNREWRVQQRAAAAQLISRAGGLGDYSSMGRRLIDALDQQAAQIESTSHNIDALSFTDDLERDRQVLLGEIGRLADQAHLLRDLMHESSVQVLRREDRLATLDKSRFRDEATGLLNRVGIEAVFDEWWQNDPARQRHLSVAQVDIDGFGGLNLERGWHVGDRLLRGLGVMIDGACRQMREINHAGRLGGQRFLLFLGDTGPRAATSATERLRQTLDASTFEDQGSELRATCTCGVVEVGQRESTDDILLRLSATITAARKQGAGRTAMDEGKGPLVVDAPIFNVPNQILQLRDA